MRGVAIERDPPQQPATTDERDERERADALPAKRPLERRFVSSENDSRPARSAVRMTACTAPLRVPAKGKAHLKGTTALSNPRLWGPPPTQTPNRYVAVTTVSAKGKVVDSYDTPFGVRQITFDADKGVFVNGERIELKGVNNHHDLGALGAAFNVRAAERQLEMLHEMGANAVRIYRPRRHIRA